MALKNTKSEVEKKRLEAEKKKIIENNIKENIKYLIDACEKGDTKTVDDILKKTYTPSINFYKVPRNIKGEEDEAIREYNIEPEKYLEISDQGTYMLNIAAKNGHTKLVEYLLKYVPYSTILEQEDANNQNVFFNAVESRSVDLINILSKHKISKPLINDFNSAGLNPLCRAIEIRDINILELLLERGAKPNYVIDKPYFENNQIDYNHPYYKMKIPLNYAASIGNNDYIDLLIRFGAKLDLMDSTGYTALHHAVLGNHLNVINKIIEKDNLLLELYDNKHDTPLHIAANSGNTKIIECLIKSGSNIYARNAEGKTPLEIMLAKNNPNLPAIEMLKNAEKLFVDKSITIGSSKQNNEEEEEDINYIKVAENNFIQKYIFNRLLLQESLNDIDLENNGKTPINMAVENNYFLALNYLLRNGADPNKFDNSKNQAIHIVLNKPSTEISLNIFKKLLTYPNIDITSPNGDGHCGIDLAILHSNVDAINLLLEKNNDILSLKGENGASVIHYAALSGNLDMILFLYSLKADINAYDNNGLRAIHYVNKRSISNEYGPDLQERYKNVAMQLIILGATIEKHVEEIKDPIIIAAEDGDFYFINYLLEKKYNIDITYFGMKASYYAMINGHENICNNLKLHEKENRPEDNFSCSNLVEENLVEEEAVEIGTIGNIIDFETTE